MHLMTNYFYNQEYCKMPKKHYLFKRLGKQNDFFQTFQRINNEQTNQT